ncbi:MAG: PilN domain-containing protein [Candidatus Omnitrophota bacterium]
MIELNLLPKELRRKKKKKPTAMPEIPVIPICIGVVCLLLVTHLTLIFLTKNNRDLSVTLKNNWDQMKPQKEKTDKFFTEMHDLQRRVEAVRLIAKPELSWAKLLNGLNQAMIPNIWLSDLKLTFEKGERREKPVSLDLTGYALGRSDVALPTVGRFMESLKKNKNFSPYFEEIELEDMRNYVISGEEVMMFRLDCRFKRKEQPKPKEKKKTTRKKKKRRRRE